MIYNGKKIEDQKKAMDRLKQLCEKEARFEIIEKKTGALYARIHTFI